MMKSYEEMAENVLERIGEYNRKKKQRIYIFKVCSIIISTMCAFVLTFVGIAAPASARELPLLGSAFAYVQDKLDFLGLYTNYAFSVGDISSDNNVDMTLSEIYCDGENLFVSYTIWGENLAKLLSEDAYNLSQLNYTASYKIISSDSSYELVEHGITGLEGEFIDKNTFVGVETFWLQDQSFPDSFRLQVRISSIGLSFDSYDDIRGNWKFDVNVSSNRDDVVTYELGVCENDHSIDRIVVSPIMVTIYSSYPNLYCGTVNYRVAVYSDISPFEEVEKTGQYNATEGVTMIPRNRIGEEMYIYVFDASSFEEGEAIDERYTIEKHSIVSAQFKLK